jgi:DNA-binding transcriptional LysR family regulator
MKLHQLRNVVAIAEHGSLRATARHLGVAQPALTRSISELERELGTPLFQRQARGVVLTPAGQLFLRRAGAIIRDVQRAKEEISQSEGGVQGSVVACFSVVPHVALLPRAIGPFRARYPKVQLHLIEGLYPTIEAGLLDGSVDFYAGPAPEGAPAAGLATETLFRNTRTVLGRRGHPLARACTLRELADAEWITTSITHAAEAELSQLFTQHRLPAPKLVMRTQSALSLMIALAYSDLLAMVPVQWTEFELAQHALHSIKLREPLVAPTIVLVRRAWLPLTPAAEFLADLLRRASGKWSRKPAAPVS